jgi:hypothetical protein
MKKIFVVLFLIVGASVFAKGEKDIFDGTWVKENGTKLTFSNQGWELLSIEDGAAGYGTSYRWSKNDKNDKNGSIWLSIKYMVNLKNYDIQNGAILSKITDLKQFQKDAIKTFGEMYPDRILDKNIEDNGMTGRGTYGSNNVKFVLEGNTLIFSEPDSAPPPTGRFFYSDALSGTFTRVN